MTIIAIVIPADARKPIGWAEHDGDPQLDWLQAQVGGFIEAVPLWDDYMGWPAVAYCNEEGKLEGLPFNERATTLWWMKLGQRGDDVLVGNVVLCVTMHQEEADNG